MARIEVLEGAVADRIAAGEVVERPAAALRELLDNALDAGATRLEVELAAGGRDLVRVADDGAGLERDDAVLAFERHATSKIRTGEDLEHITTLGFRGEALAAIAAVSRVEMVTRESGAPFATRVLLERGRLLKVEEASRAPGTTVSVQDLFVGVPARKKFLKAPSTELDHCLRVAERVALARPEVGLRLRHAGRAMIAAPSGQGAEERIRTILARRGGRELVEAAATEGALSVRAWAGRRDMHRHGRDGIHLFINHRPVRDPLLVRAVVDVYRPMLPPGRFPIVVLYLEMPPEDVDVNVHPAKSEVRFARPREVRSLIVRALDEAIAERAAIPSLPPKAFVAQGVPTGDEGWTEVPPWTPSSELLERADRQGAPLFAPPAADEDALPEAPAAPLFEASPADPGQGALYERGARVLAQFRDTFILAEDARGLLIVDQHVAHERILYEELSNQADAGDLPRQALMFPRPLEVEPRHLDLIEEQRATLERLGFRLERFGDDAVLVREVPAVLGKQARPEALIGVLERLDVGDKTGSKSLFDHLLATVACHAAVKKGYALGPEKLAYLLQGLDKCESPSHCPHGRAISFRIDIERLNHHFERS